ncbi:MAG TPA: amidohydrolase, partial [Gemmatimonadetes bacterium]|nr:amidohydrolase [Gemmatimonadota bacterium]
MIHRTPAHPVPIALTVLSVMGLVPVPEASEQAVIEVTVRAGTNMAAALSPDGRTLAIDALGRIWTLPATGGTAIALTDPEGDARQPSWSPDGTRIAFQAYWAGDYDVWAINADGSGLAQITSGPFDDREPHWSPDGSSVAFSSDRSGTYDIWEVTLADGEVQRLTDGDDNEYGPAYAPGGDALAYVADGISAGVWVRSSSGATDRVVDAYSAGSSLFGVSWSPDGARLSYNVQDYGSSRIHVAPASPNAGSAQLVSDADEDVFPFRASWRGSRLVYTADGQIRTRLATGGAASEIPFEATVTLDRPTYRKALRDFDDTTSKPVQGIVSPAVSPGGDRVAFAALGDLWVMPIGSDPIRLTNDAYVETDPAWSPDGSRLAYASDRSGELQVWVHNVDSGEMRQVTDDGGGVPVWSPHATEIAYIASGGRVSDIRIISLSTGETRTVRSGLNNPGRVSWSPDGEQLAVSAHWRYSTRFREGVNKALLISLGRVAAQDTDYTADANQESMTRGGNGPYTPTFSGNVEELPKPLLQANERWLEFFPHGSVGTRSTDGPVWSPNGRFMAYVSTGVLWVIPVTPGGDPLGPPRRLTNELADDPTWAGNSESIVYLTTDRLRRVWLTDGRIEDIPVSLSWQRSIPTGRVVVHAGALFDGVSESLHRNIDIVINGNRIVRVDPHDDAFHVGEIVDATDGVVSPGLIEMHTHGGLASGEQL